MLGMITAFAECLAGEAKKLAFSPPFYPEDYKSLRKEAEQICQEQGVFVWYEENAELPADKKVHWLVLFKYPEVLEEYKKLRQEGVQSRPSLREIHESSELWDHAFSFTFQKLLL